MTMMPSDAIKQHRILERWLAEKKNLGKNLSKKIEKKKLTEKNEKINAEPKKEEHKMRQMKWQYILNYDCVMAKNFASCGNI